MEFRLAELADVGAVRAFFARNLPRGSDGVYTDEFYCPLGIKAAIQRRQMLLAVDQKRIAGAVRFYPKKNGEYSLYQFAVDASYRGQKLACALFDAVRGRHAMRAMCLEAAPFNEYYRHAGWRLESSASGMNHWVLDASVEESRVL